ncbi:hypothetical protein GCM10008939_06380 [Deinococcus aquiradiocola]|uniref:Uncharacterized protein n=1 Tax=Deinococcus aquiradiocola TaxID=393059 RepID=A0A917ULA5_9DEIO|nr:hypothetical protein GCM10008939_06380 [Deinococcus aquiradiocola]
MTGKVHPEPFEGEQHVIEIWKNDALLSFLGPVCWPASPEQLGLLGVFTIRQAADVLYLR